MKALLVAIAMAACGLLVSDMALARKNSCNGLSGYYGNVTAIVVGEDGLTVNITLAGDRQNGYGICNPDGSFYVYFPDDPGTHRGHFDGRTIYWDNGTTWTKYFEYDVPKG